ncbi:MAG: PCRF domain-containing protein, partial [Flavobacteriales bacterium]|nr:PCRF domain-containing protein [Flavobacteriales bacterium]
MVTQDQIKDFERRVGELYDYLKIDEKKIEVQEGELKSQDPSFWDNPKEAEVILKKVRAKKFWIESHEELTTELEDLKVLIEFHEAGESTEEEIDEQYQASMQKLEELEFKNMLSAEEDNLNAVMQITAG